MDWVTRIDFRMTGVRTGMHFSESWMHFKKHDEAVTGFSVAGLTFQFTLKKSQFRIIIHIHTYNRLIQGMSPITAMIIQALKAIGKGNLNEKQFEIIRRRLSDADKVAVLNETQQTSVWLNNTIKQICS